MERTKVHGCPELCGRGKQDRDLLFVAGAESEHNPLSQAPRQSCLKLPAAHGEAVRFHASEGLLVDLPFQIVLLGDS